jgi:hypothetical protein
VREAKWVRLAGKLNFSPDPSEVNLNEANLIQLV